MSTTISYTELVRALAEAKREGLVETDGLSTAEWAEVWGVGIQTALNRIKSALKSGLMKPVTTMRTNVLGRECPTQVYQLQHKGKRSDRKRR